MKSRLVKLDIYYGWIIVTGCFIGAMITFGTIYSFSVFFEHILTEFNRSHSDTSSIFALQSIVTFTSAGFLGFFIDRYGVRRMFLIGTGLIAIGLLGVSQVSTFGGIVVSYGVVAGGGLGVIFVASFATPPRWFDRRRGLATGLAASGNGVGVLIGPALASWLITKYSWRTGYTIMMVLIVLLLLIVVSLIADDPSETDSEGATKYRDTQSNPDHTKSDKIQIDNVIDIAKSKSFVFLFLGFLFAFTPIYVVLVYLVEFTSNTDLGRGIGILTVSVIGVGSVLGNLSAGSFSDYAGVVRTFVLSCILLGGSTILMPFSIYPILLVGLGAVFGLGYGGIAALQPLLVARFFGTVNVRSLFGLTAPAFAITGSTVPYLVGLGYDLFQSFILAFIAGGIIGLFGGVVIPIGNRINRSSK